jgi:hypothetical protein
MTNCIPEPIRVRMETIGRTMVDEMEKLCEQMLEGAGLSLKEIEEGMRDMVKRAGLEGMSVVVGEIERERFKGAKDCPTCGQAVYWTRYAKRQCISTLGEFEIERAYYYCPACRAGWCPLDEQLGLGRGELSPVAEEITSYLGAFMPFGRAADFLARSGLLQISHDTVNNTSVRIGQMLAEQQQAEVDAIWEGEQPYPEYEGPQVPQVMYLSGDGVRYLAADGQGRELKVAAVYETEIRANDQGEQDPHAIHTDYVVSDQQPGTFSRAVEVVTQRRGLRQARTPVVLQDGAIWLWQTLAPLAGPERVEIVDFCHAAGYVSGALAALLPDQKQRGFWADILLTCLKAGQPGLVADTLRHLLSDPGPLLTEVQEACDYLRSYAHRMAYHDYQAAGLQIASGTMESGVKQVASDRLKQAGMRWNPAHAHALVQVRAAILSHRPRWDAFWRSYHPPPRPYQRHAQAA